MNIMLIADQADHTTLPPQKRLVSAKFDAVFLEVAAELGAKLTRTISRALRPG